MQGRFAAIIVACGLLCAVAGVARAQEVERIAAVVNDEMISMHDLEARLKLAIVIANMPDNLENRRRVLPQVLRKMVDERLQLQEAARVKVAVAPEELKRSIAGIEQQNRMPPGGLLAGLAKAGVDADVVRDQIKADLTWLKLTSRMLQPTIRVGEEEITDRLDSIRLQLGQPEYLLAEIFLSVDQPKQEDEARRLGERLLDQLRAGAPFSSLARQFSQSAGAGSGGVMGWMVESFLDDDIRGTVVRLDKGAVSPLIRTGNGFTIVTVLDKRIVGSVTPEETVSLMQVEFPNPANGNHSREQLAAKAADLTRPLKDCQEMEDLIRKVKSDKSGRFDNVLLSSLQPHVQKGIAGLAINKASAPQDIGGGLMVYMVCARSSSIQQGGLPSRDVIRRGIEDEKLDLAAKRYIRDLRRAAFVDFRL